MYQYVATSHPSTLVTHSAVGNFTGSDDWNLVLGRGNRLEIFKLTEEGLAPVLNAPVYGKIASLHLVRIQVGRSFLLRHVPFYSCT